MGMETGDAYSLERAIHRLAQLQDMRDFEGFLGVMLEDSNYLVTTQAPELKQEMTWMQLTKQELEKRLASLAEHEWEIGQLDQSRIISVNNIEKAREITRTSSNFAIYNTDDMGKSSLYAVGIYEDKWVLQQDTWRLEQRQVVLKTRQISPLSPLPL